ncbi:energy transducer TonB [bacterium]|nr:energy transducer TonB [bacterium]
MFKFQTAWQKEGLILTNRFVAYLPKNALCFKTGKNYIKRLEIGFIGSLLLVTMIFITWKKLEHNTILKKNVLSELVVEDIPQTKQMLRTAAPKLPTIPVASEDESLPDDETIDFTDLDIAAEPPPPPPPPSDSDMDVMFVAFDEPPKPVGGFAAIKRSVIYPEIAQKAGIEGTVVLNLRISSSGSIDEIRIVQSIFEALDKAAEAAVRSVKWLPAKQREEPVAVWYVVPIEFKLRAATKR